MPKLNHRLQSATLFFALLASLLVGPLLTDGKFGTLMVGLVYLVLAAAGGYSMVRERGWVIVFMACVLGAMACEISISKGAPLMPWRGIAAGAGMYAYFLLFKAVFNHSFFQDGVPISDRLLAGICGYLLLVGFWATIAQLAETLLPGSFIGQGLDNGVFTRASANYFSMVTVSTLGYGDIVPTNNWAQLISGLAAVSGTLYLAVFIAAIMSGVKAKRRKAMETPGSESVSE